MDPFVIINGEQWDILYCCVCLTSLDKVKPPALSIEMKENFELGERLESVYPLLDIIFEYLNDKDLDNVMNVKKSWGSIAERLLKKRSQPCWVTCYQDRGNVFFKDSGNLHFNNASAAIVLFGRHYNLNEYISLHEDTNTFQQMKFVEYFNKEIISRNISFCILTCPKVVSYFSQDVENRYGSIFDTLFLPVIPGIRTTMFYCNFSKLKKNPGLLEKHIKPSEEVKCLLLFDEYDIRSSVDHLFKIILKETKPEELALGGGLIHGIDAFNKQKEIPEITRNKNETFCIAFTKERGTEPNFNAASFVIRGSELTEEELNEELLKFKKNIIMRSNSIALRVCCQAKKGKKKESLIFNAHFPNTSLLGLEAAGEIGWNCFNLPHAEEPVESKPKKSKKHYPKFQHEWSTVFVVITWGDIVEM
ncbi:uncharacterized protein LOC123322856 isoform X2 [Coccinella septempunctata]|uniref:uncharacterized protein LOC123322856 isoform X2 n=1 Tax=Coccinella septempunctata TaxID=41139 RepID=UPI001D080AE8|nr:uncharacterized protein LOC123322856 isoform X2 [Coccinella septempunctata]